MDAQIGRLMRHINRTKFVYRFKGFRTMFDIQADGVDDCVTRFHRERDGGFVANIRVNGLNAAGSCGRLGESGLVWVSGCHPDVQPGGAKPLRDFGAEKS